MKNKGLASAGKTIKQRLNILNLIDELEQINAENIQESERREMVKCAVEACKKEMRDHLEHFLQTQPGACYEDWIKDLHPENAQKGGNDLIDHRFYAENSDHRLMWNEFISNNDKVENEVSSRFVHTRNIKPNYEKKI